MQSWWSWEELDGEGEGGCSVGEGCLGVEWEGEENLGVL